MLVSFSDLDDPLGFLMEKMDIVTEHWLELMLRTEDQPAVPLILYLKNIIRLKGTI